MMMKSVGAKSAAYQRKVQRYQDQLDSRLLKVKCSKSKGRHLVASASETCIPAGTLLFSEYPIAYIVKHDLIHQYCSLCTRALPHSTAAVQSCSACNAVWCGEQCRNADSRRPHGRNCCDLVQKRCADVSRWNSADLDLVRISYGLSTIISSDHHDNTRENGSDDCKLGIRMPNDAIDDMISNQSMADPKWEHSVTEVAKDLIELLPDDHVPFQDPNSFVKLACRVNSNAHSIMDHQQHQHRQNSSESSSSSSSKGNGVVGLGMFPVTALINHSCCPNVIYVTETSAGNWPRLSVRTIRDIQPGEEITLAYINVLQPRQVRQETLMLTKYFQCLCKRCTECAADAYLDSVRCVQCQTGVYASDSSHSSDIYDCDFDEDETSSYCNECGHEMPQDFRFRSDSLKKSLDHDYMSSAQWLTSTPPRLPFAQQCFERLLEKYSPLFHPLNYKLLQTRIELLTIYNYLGGGDPLKAISTCKSIVETFEMAIRVGILPSQFWPEYSDYLFTYGEMCELYGQYFVEISDDERLEWAKRGSDAFSKCSAIRQVIYPSDTSDQSSDQGN